MYQKNCKVAIAIAVDEELCQFILLLRKFDHWSQNDLICK
jgi:hypothetical protein